MDPDATLAELRTMVADSFCARPWAELDYDRMAELVHALDEWISRGGFLPAAWSREA